jgi:tRNA dimethylallyltransferase
VGKTTAVSALAQQVDAVIYADAWSAYRGLNIGVAKPTSQEQAQLPHYMIDILDWHEQLNVAGFVQQSDAIVQHLASQGQQVVFSGGTLYYLRHFLYGLPTTPPSSEQTRAYVAKMAAQLGPMGLYQQLQAVDSVSAERLAYQDSYRVSRALEVYYDSGRPLSSYRLEKECLRDQYDFCLIELTRPREELYQRINLRVDAMWQAGLVQEVAALRAEGFSQEMPAAKAIGYRQFFSPDSSEGEIKEAIKTASRRYAKRQLTFLQTLPINYRLAADDIAGLQQCVANFLKRPKG